MATPHDILQDPDVQPEQDQRPLEVGDRPFTIADLDRLPAILTPAHMQWIFEMKHSKFYQLVKQGAFDRFEDKSFVGVRRWSGALVAAHFKAGGRVGYFFGRKRSA